LFAKKPVESQNNSLVDSKQTEISNVSSESSLMTDDIISIDDQPSYSTSSTLLLILTDYCHFIAFVFYIINVLHCKKNLLIIQ